MSTRVFPVKNNMEAAPSTKIMLNVGAGLDIPTGTFMPGIHGERILNGGLPIVFGITGKGNNFKSTVEEYMLAKAAARVEGKLGTSITTHDTEENKQEARMTTLYQRIYEFKDRDLFAEEMWKIVGKSQAYGDKFFLELKEFLLSKRENRKAVTVETPFLNRDGKDRMTMMQPTFTMIDSFSEFETSDIAKMMDDNALGESGGNTIYMRQSLAKNRLLMEYPTLGIANQHYLLTTAHFGKELQMASGPYAPPPEKKMNSMKPGEKVKGVPDKFFYLVHWLVHATGSFLLVNQGTKGCEYPADTQDNEKGHKDLWEVPLLTLRSKFGSSSWSTNLVVSQSEGVLPSLTEFHILKESRWGLEGNLQNYHLSLIPTEKLSRTVIRKKLDSNPALRRAVNITCELYQMSIYHRGMRGGVPTPAVLAEKLKERGYSMDMILAKTRGWWKPDNEVHPLLFLSTMDLINMANGEYHPYWLEEDKVTIKKKYIVDEPYEFN